MRRRTVLHITALLGLFAGMASAQPGIPTLTGRVVDLAEIVGPAAESVMESRLTAFEDSTGHQLAVLTVPALNGEALEPFATKVFRAWALGDAERDDGVLLLVARDDRKIRIEVGYGLEGALPDAFAARVIRSEMTPRFREGDFDGGILGAVDALTAAASGTSVAETERVDAQIRPVAGYKPWLDGAWWAHLLFVLAVGGVAVWLAVRSFAREALAGRLFHASLATAALVFVYAQLGSYVSILVAHEPSSLANLIHWVIRAPIVLFPVSFLVLDLYAARAPAFAPLRKRREAIQRASRNGKRFVTVGGETLRVPRWSAGTSLTSGGSGTHSYRSGSSSSGGFSGSGGSSGGGGASGGW